MCLKFYGTTAIHFYACAMYSAATVILTSTPKEPYTSPSILNPFLVL